VVIGCLENLHQKAAKMKKGRRNSAFSPIFLYLIEFIIIYFDSAQNGRSNGILTKNSTIPALTPPPPCDNAPPLTRGFGANI
jgi:hypothetical protein